MPPSDSYYDRRLPVFQQHGHTLKLWFALPPFPGSMVERDVHVTPQQDAVLRVLREWHWRFSPSIQDVADLLGVHKERVRTVLIGLRNLGWVEWLDGQDRTLHLTPEGQRAVGLYIGALALQDAPAGLRLPVWRGASLQTAIGGQVVWRRRHTRPRRIRRYYKIPPSLQPYRAWLRGRPGRKKLDGPDVPAPLRDLEENDHAG